ncbi:MAG: insulinase family protein [Oscillospiraceae bacterium]
MNKISYGFELLKSQKIDEVNGEAFEYVHEKTKAHLLFLKTDDNNKAFAIGFRTPPNDSTGVPHIIEHSVLCGSDKYTTKEPFVNLMKGSLNTFLNAFTYPDKTMYPYSTQNLEDYKNILGIYVDAVFHPKMRTIKEIFYQEGWHFELENKDAPLTINGVVYSEMKGAYSSPEEVLDEEINKALFDNCYKYSSGGNPDVIPTLTYEDYLEFHSKYYHPSNSCIYVYGNINVEEIMEILDRDYLSNYEYKNVDSEVKLSQPLTEGKSIKSTYSISEDDSDEDKTFASVSYVIPEAIDQNLELKLEVLADVLFNADSSPIKNKLLQENLCQNVECYCDNHKLQPVFSIIIQNTTPENAQKAFDIIDKTMRELVENKVDKELLDGCISNAEFSFKETSTIRTGRGVNFAAKLFARYFYGQEPFSALKFNEALAEMKKMAEGNGFEELIEKYLLGNTFKVNVILTPEKGLSKCREEELAAKLQEYKNKLSDGEIEKIISENKALKLRQSTADSKADLDTIPNLKISDIDKKISKIALDEAKKKNYTLYHYNASTNGVVYGRIMFNANGLKSKELPYLGLISNALSILATENYTAETLPNEIMRNIGQITFSPNAFSDINDNTICHKYFEVNFKAVEEKLPKAISLVKEMLYSTKFDDKEKLKQILNMIISKMQGLIISNGQIFGFMRLNSKFSPTGDFIEKTSFYTFYDFVKNTAADFDKNYDGLVDGLKAVMNKVLNNGNIVFAVTGSETAKNVFEEEVSKIASNIAPTTLVEDEKFVPQTQTEGFMTSSNVQYVCMGYNYKDLGYEYNGKFEVLKTILSTDYLWNTIRVLGGAYGAPLRISNDGNFMFGSYRDPNLENSLEVYRKSTEYVANLDLGETEFTNYIIGTMQNVDAPKTPEQKCAIAVENKLRNISDEFLQKTRDELLSTTQDDIKNFAKLIKDVTDKNLYVTFGNANRLKQSKDIFDVIINA